MSKGLLQLTTEWGRAGEPSPKGDASQPPLTSRTSDASRSDAGSSKLGDISNGGNAPPEIVTKKKKTPKFLMKQFGKITKGSSSAATTPRTNHLKLLGQDYVLAVPGSALPHRGPASASETASVDPLDDRSVNEAASVSESANHQHRNISKPPIEFVTAPVDYKTENVREEEAPLDFITEESPRVMSRVARGSSRSHSSVARSNSGSERLSYTPRSERSVLSVPETVISSNAEQVYSRGSVKSRSRASSASSLVEWSGGSLDRHGELSIAALSLGEGRNIGGLSRRTDVTSAQSPARSETQAPDYSPDDTDSGVEMYHETTSASPGSYSRRSSLSEELVSEFDESDGVAHQYHRSKHRNNDYHSRSFSYSRSQSGSARYSPSSSTRINRGQYFPNNTLRKFVSNKQFLDSPSGRLRHHGDYYGHRRNLHPNSSNLPNRRHGSSSQKRRDDVNSKVSMLLGKYGHKKEHHGPRGDMDDMVALDSLTPQQAIAVFHDEVARMMDEEGEDCLEANDVEEFLDGYLRLRSPFYVSMVDEFFRVVCVDCYKRPMEFPAEGRSGSSSLRSDSQLHHFHNLKMRM